MAVQSAATSIARSAPKRRPALAPVPDAAPKLHRDHHRQAVAVENDVIEASAELVFQRDDLAEAASPENNRALTQAIKALDARDYSLCRELIRVALFAEEAEDAAIARAQARRDAAHGHTKSAAGRIEAMLTGRRS